MFTEDKITESFCIADDFYRFFDAQMKKYTVRDSKKRKYQRDSTMSKAEIMMIIILFRVIRHFEWYDNHVVHIALA